MNSFPSVSTYIFYFFNFHRRTLSHRHRIPIQNPKSKIIIHQSLGKSRAMEED